MNLVPAVGELNADRSNRRYGALVPQSNQYGECKFEVDFKNNKAYIKKDIWEKKRLETIKRLYN